MINWLPTYTALLPEEQAKVDVRLILLPKYHALHYITDVWPLYYIYEGLVKQMHLKPK